MKRRELLIQMTRIAKHYGIEFDKDHPVHGGRHDKFLVGGHSVEVPRHTEIVEYTARGILRTFEQLCAEASKEEHP
jgi:mRNA interferase HicA